MNEFASVVSVGGLLPSDLLREVAAGSRELHGTSAESYGLAPGERLNDQITRSWNRLTGVWGAFNEYVHQRHENDETATTLTRQRWLNPLFDELGFSGLPTARARVIDGKEYAISHQWGDSVPIHLLGAEVPIDRRSPGVPGAARTSPHGLVQEYLNRSDAHLWALLSNGRTLRLLRDNASLTRQAYVEFDLNAIFEGELYSDFALLWLACHRSRFEGDPPEKCWLEQWSQHAATTGTRALDRLRDGVEAAIVNLGEGFLAHRANADLRDRLASGALSVTTYQRQLLRVVYRLLFLLVAESRDLLLAPGTDDATRVRYRDHYSLARLTRLARVRRGTAHDDLWAGLKVTIRALWRDGEPVLGLSPLGSDLWSPDSVKVLRDARLDNAHLLEAVRNLTITRDAEAKADRTVDYRNLGAEELGSIYEGLLELRAEVDVARRTFTLVMAEGNERKTTGSYYTPTKLISELLDAALEPVLDKAMRKPDPEQALLRVSVLDPACGSGHFLIATANRIASRLATVRSGDVEPAPSDVRRAIRDVVGRCVHGIDVNPMAVELCKVSLWLEAMEPGKPLSFLDHHIACGNALLGTTPKLLAEGIPDTAFKAVTGDDKEYAKALRRTNKAERKNRAQGFLALHRSVSSDVAHLAAAARGIDATADDTPEQVEDKEVKYARLRASGPAVKAKLVADAWCAAFVMRKTPSELPITDKTLRELEDCNHEQLIEDIWASGQSIQAHGVASQVVGRILYLADEFRFIHPHLAFPHVFEVPEDLEDASNLDTGWSRGFDVVLGNPPFLNQLRKLTATQASEVNLRSHRFGDMASTYTDTANLFLALSCGMVCQNFGHVGLVQPESLLAADGALEVRRKITSSAALTFLWLASEQVFSANVLTCALVARMGPRSETYALERACGADFRPLPDLRVVDAKLSQMPTWGPLIADGLGVPRVQLEPAACLADVATTTADFRDQYYGLVPFVVEAIDRKGDIEAGLLVPLVTVGLIDPLHNLWGTVTTRFAKSRWHAPAVDIARLRAESDLGEWADQRLIPKLLIATQTPVLEVIPDEVGNMLPSVPAITVVPEGISLWHAAALLTSPALTAWAAAHHLGASLSTNAIKLSAKQVASLPVPPKSEAWDAAAVEAQSALRSTSREMRLAHLKDLASLMCVAFEVKEPDELIAWWSDRLPKRDTAVDVRDRSI
ncbi:MAG: N-6 DNA methylase [Acidimicrobiales bacterium]|nr:N-6 DNA methylase [Acidimicrobiales bacterium]MYD34558.1 N-6 DNA methylase [Acidimicrobiales bacterium]MYI09020.1 N-6 DNA methylase [Acidimicrobiales bacterium]